MFGQPFSKFAFIQPMCKERVVWVDITEHDRADMRARIIRFCEYHWRHDFTPKPDNAGCSRCEVKHACPKYVGKVGEDGKRRLSIGSA
jgi:hypothetical protein